MSPVIPQPTGLFNSFEALPDAPPYRYAIFYPDAKFGEDVVRFLTSTRLKPKRTSIQSRWQNGTAERWVGSCRREMLDQVIAINERHLLRLLHDYVGYYHQDRIHDALKQDAPTGAAKTGSGGKSDFERQTGRSPSSIRLAHGGVAGAIIRFCLHTSSPRWRPTIRSRSRRTSA
jgi:hypothetical protein